MQSPFKFLDSYDKSDSEIFFGREQETAQLYNAVFASNLTILYGSSGTGKTSLINCGLGNKFYDTDWNPIFIRREDNFPESINSALKSSLKNQVPDNFDNLTLPEKVKMIFTEQYRPVYLIFDQFEELYILGSPREQSAFYRMVSELLKSGLQAKVLISIREAWIAHLSDFERVIPTLFDNRLRVERMNDRNIYRVISGTCRAYNIKIDHPSETILKIIENLKDKKERVDLTNLQVYLDRLYKEELIRKGANKEAQIVFNLQLVNHVGKIENVLSDFLDEQLTNIEYKLQAKNIKNPKGLPLEILFTLVTDDGTKQPMTTKAIIEALPKNRKISEKELEFCMEEFKGIKILRQLG